MKTLAIAFAIVILAPAVCSAADPTWVAGYPKIKDGIIVAKGDATPGKKEKVRIRLRLKGNATWGVNTYATKTGDGHWTVNFDGIQSGDHELQIVCIDDSQSPEVEGSSSTIQIVTVP